MEKGNAILGKIIKVEKTTLNFKTGETHTEELKGEELEAFIKNHEKPKQEEEDG